MCVLCLHREAVERDMRFLGLFLMRNLVKPETAGVIQTLRQAQLRTVMVTGEWAFHFILSESIST